MTWEDVHEFADRYRLRTVSMVAFGVFSLMLFGATHWPNPPKVEIAAFQPSDKIQHFVGYLIFTTLLHLMLRCSRSRIWAQLGRWNLQSLCVLGFVFVVGSVDELTQPWVGRTCSAYDLAADMGGAIVATLLFTALDVATAVSRRFRWSRCEPLELL